MSNFVLVHGAWMGAWAWERVSEGLEESRESADVEQVLSLDLPGHGRRFSNEIRRITVEHYIQAVVTLVQALRVENVVLVGHGFAATFLPQAVLELGDRVKRVVFIAGELPPEGKSAYDRLPRRDKIMLWAFKARENGFRFPDFIFKNILCNGLDESSTREVLSRLVPEPMIPWRTAVSRKGFSGSIPTTYVVLNRDKAIRPALQERYLRSLDAPKVERLDAGHGVLLSHPKDVVSILLKYA